MWILKEELPLEWKYGIVLIIRESMGLNKYTFHWKQKHCIVSDQTYDKVHFKLIAILTVHYSNLLSVGLMCTNAEIQTSNMYTVYNYTFQIQQQHTIMQTQSIWLFH